MPLEPRVRQGLTWAFLGVLLFSFSLPLTKVAIEGFNPFFTASARAVVAAAIAIVVLLVLRAPWPPRAQWRPLLLTMLGAVFGWPILLALALEHTTSAHAAVIAAFMPLTTAMFAVLRTKEQVALQFWVAAGLGTAALVIFTLIRARSTQGSLLGDLLIVGAVISSSWCYVEGASISKVMPGWQVISWVVVFALPVTLPATILLWLTTSANYQPTVIDWSALILLGISSMYVGFIAWYQGLAMSGIAYGGQMQQLQAPLTLVWSAWWLSESVTWGTVLAACAVIGCVVWAQRSREHAGLTSQQ
ncbi:MAG: DMT family transporter [Actinomycetales bacterium]|nr:DMT family transporter [Actinomycetales bacterium]